MFQFSPRTGPTDKLLRSPTLRLASVAAAPHAEPPIGKNWSRWLAGMGSEVGRSSMGPEDYLRMEPLAHFHAGHPLDPSMEPENYLRMEQVRLALHVQAVDLQWSRRIISGWNPNVGKRYAIWKILQWSRRIISGWNEAYRRAFDTSNILQWSRRIISGWNRTPKLSKEISACKGGSREPVPKKIPM